MTSSTVPSSTSESVNFSNQLTYLAFKVEAILKRYVVVHDKRLKTAGSLISLLKNLIFHIQVNFAQIYEEIDEVYQDFNRLITRLIEMKNDYQIYTKIQQDFYNNLVDYSDALLETIKALRVVASKQNELSKGWENGKLTLKEDLNLEKLYQEKILGYMRLGGKLNNSFQQLKSEAIHGDYED